MQLFTGNTKYNTLSQINVDNGARESAIIRWERYKEDSKRSHLYHQNTPNITPEDSRYLLDLERIYVEIYSQWEEETLSDEQYKILQDYLPPEYFLNVLSIYLCTRYYDLPQTIEELKENRFKLRSADCRYFSNYLRLLYQPAVIDFMEKCKGLRPVSVVYDEISSLMSEALTSDNGKIPSERLSKLSDLIGELYTGMHLFLVCLNDSPRTSDIELSDIFEDFAKVLEAKGLERTAKQETDPITETPLSDISAPTIKEKQEFYSKALEDVIKPQSLEFPVDKVNKNIWGLLEKPLDKYEQLSFTFAMENKADKKKGTEIDLTYSIDFSALEKAENLKITKKLTPYDKRVYTAISALYNAGNQIISLSQIYSAMGNTSRMNSRDSEKINNALTKMRMATIYISNEQEAKAYNYRKFVYDGSLLPMERINGVNINGKVTESAIHLLREPPMISFARNHGNQLTTVNIKVLQSPISKTDSNLQIEDYLIDRISKAKTKSLSNKILISSICENAHITDRMQKSRLPEKLEKYLTHFKKCNYIKGFTLTKDSVIIDV